MEQIINLKEKNKTEETPKAEIVKETKPAKKIKDTLEWKAPEFQHYPKDQSWFIISALIAFGLIIWAAFSKNFLLILMIVLGYFSIVVFALKKPRKIRLAITPKGIMIDESLYAYDNLKSFWIFYDPPEVKELSLRSKKTIMPYIKIPLGDENPVKVRELLLKYLPERRQEESIIDNLARSLKY